MAEKKEKALKEKPNELYSPSVDLIKECNLAWAELSDKEKW